MHECLQNTGDRKLLFRVNRYLSTERRVQAKFLEHLAEIDRRKLWALQGYASCYKYLVHSLGLSPASASKRFAAARLGQKQPELFTYIASGELNLTTASMIASKIREEKGQDAKEIIENVRGLTKEEVSRLFARKRPTEPRDDAQLVAVAVPPEDPEHPNGRTEVEDRVQVTMTLTPEEYEDLKRLQALRARKKAKSPKLRDVVNDAVQKELDRKDPERKARRHEQRQAARAEKSRSAGVHGGTAANRGRDASYQKNSRHIPARVKHEVWGRDGGQCTFVSQEGHRCEETCNLEFDHVIPWSLGGRSDSKSNIRLRCPAHNLLAAREAFGERFVTRKIKEAQEKTFSAKVVRDENEGHDGELPDLWPSLWMEG